MPVLDIMLPHYGDLGLLQLAVNSIIGQTDPNWQLTVVDDGQGDGVAEWFAQLGHPRVRYLRNERNLGLSANFQRCLDLAELDFMVMMGCDDVMLPNYVAVVRRMLHEQPGAGIVQPGVEPIGSDGRPVRTLVDETKKRVYAPKVSGTLVLAGEDLAVSLLRGHWLYFPSLCWRTSEIKAVGFDQHLAVVLDLSAILQLAERGAQLVVGDELAFQYRRHAVSASSTSAVTGSRFDEERAFFLDVAARMEARGWRRAGRAARWHLSSRIHALTMLPAAAKQRNVDGLRTLSGHAFGSLHDRNRTSNA